MSLPTLADLKAELNITGTANDGELVNKLDQAVDVVEGIVGPITSRTVTETHRNVSSDVLVLRRMPVADLVSVSVRNGATTTPLLLDDYELEVETGLLRRMDGGWFAGSFTVTYSAGLPVVPAAIAGAILIVAAHLWETQRGAAPAGPLNTDELSVSPGLGYAIPNRALELLAPYRRPAVA